MHRTFSHSRIANEAGSKNVQGDSNCGAIQLQRSKSEEIQAEQAQCLLAG